jgi:hypothetical protein
MAFLAEVGAERDKDQQTKTRWALEYYVSKLAKPRDRKAAAKATTKPKPKPKPKPKKNSATTRSPRRRAS